MSSKKNESKKLFESMHIEPEHALPETPKSEDVHEEPKVEALDENQSKELTPANPDTTPKEESKPDNEETASDEILEEVRQSLLQEEEAHEKEEDTKWWKRIGKKPRRSTAAPETPKVVEEIDLPRLETTEAETVAEANPVEEPKEEVDELDDLIDLLAVEQSTSQDKQLTVPETVVPTPKPEPEPEKVVDIEELKKQAFEPRSSTVEEENSTEVRSIALEGGDQVFVEVEATKQDPLEERLAAVENALKPYQRYLYAGLAVLGLIMAVIAGLVLFNIYRETVAASAPTPIPSNVPYPTSVSLPGGWTFKLGKGTLVAGSWDPKGAEWLQGTEVCRWVALPWSRQLEAVVRTLNPNDPINLGMSNNDTLTYKVYSIKQMSPAEMQQLDSNTPCLLVVLVQPDSDKRWVLTSLP